MRFFSIILAICCLLGVFPQVASAQLETSAAVLPIQTDQPLPARTTRDIHNALSEPLAARPDYSIVAPQVDGAIGSFVDPNVMAGIGDRLNVDQVVGCRLEVSKTSVPDHNTYTYKIAYFFVPGRLMIAYTQGRCNDCTADRLILAIQREARKIYGGPYPLALDTEPSGARVTFEGELWGTTPFSILLLPQTYKILIQKEGYKPMEVEFPMPEDRPISASLPLQKDPDFVPPVAAVVPAPAPAPARAPEPQADIPENLPMIGGPTKAPKKEPPPKKEPADTLAVAPPPTPPVAAPPAPAPAPPEAPQVEPQEKPAPEPRIQTEMSTVRKWAWRTTGLATAFALAGVGLTVAAVNADTRAGDPTFSASLRADYADRRDGYWIGAYTAYGLAAASLTASLVLFFAVDEEPALSVAPSVAPDGVGVAATLRY